MPAPFPSDPVDDTDRRLTDLEVKASFAEDLLDDLNAIVARQQRQIDQLVLEVTHLRQQGAAADPTAFRSVRDELPPHY